VKETTTFWHAGDIGELELLKASYVSHTFSRHTHPGYVIAIIERGVEAYDYRGRTHFAMPGDIVLINPDTVHTGHAGVKSGWSYRVFYPSIDLLQGLAEDMAQNKGNMPYFETTVIRDPLLARDLQKLHRILERSASRLDRQSRFNATMGRLLAKHAGNPPQIMPPRHEHRALQKAVAYIHGTLCENISLEALSAHAGLSPFYLSRVFTRHMGLPPHTYRKQLRIHKAKQLLRRRMPISQVAVETGFADQSHLTRHFKQIVGVTPGQYIGL
jgi:AraC-like DNA-binding protein